MSELRRGWVIDVDLEPTKGSEMGKVRPCIVVTNDVYNERVPVIPYSFLFHLSLENRVNNELPHPL